METYIYVILTIVIIIILLIIVYCYCKKNKLLGGVVDLIYLNILIYRFFNKKYDDDNIYDDNIYDDEIDDDVFNDVHAKNGYNKNEVFVNIYTGKENKEIENKFSTSTLKKEKSQGLKILNVKNVTFEKIDSTKKIEDYIYIQMWTLDGNNGWCPIILAIDKNIKCSMYYGVNKVISPHEFITIKIDPTKGILENYTIYVLFKLHINNNTFNINYPVIHYKHHNYNRFVYNHLNTKLLYSFKRFTKTGTTSTEVTFKKPRFKYERLQLCVDNNNVYESIYNTNLINADDSNYFIPCYIDKVYKLMVLDGYYIVDNISDLIDWIKNINQDYETLCLQFIYILRVLYNIKTVPYYKLPIDNRIISQTIDFISDVKLKNYSFNTGNYKTFLNQCINNTQRSQSIETVLNDKLYPILSGACEFCNSNHIKQTINEYDLILCIFDISINKITDEE